MTKDEFKGLMADLLVTDSPAAGSTNLTDWARDHADTLGKSYANELTRRRNCEAEYASLYATSDIAARCSPALKIGKLRFAPACVVADQGHTSYN